MFHKIFHFSKITISDGKSNISKHLSQLARKMVGAELQRITYSEFLPVVLGKRALGNLADVDSEYDQNVDPSILNEFATVAFR